MNRRKLLLGLASVPALGVVSNTAAADTGALALDKLNADIDEYLRWVSQSTRDLISSAGAASLEASQPLSFSSEDGKFRIEAGRISIKP